jgi:Tol biopolymer transport system component
VVDTAKYTVRAGNAARIGMTVRDTAVTVGATYNIGASVADRYGNPRTETPIFAPVNPYVTVDAAGVVKATSAGRALITVKSGTFTDTSRVSIIPDGTIVGVSAVSGQGGIAVTKLDGTGFLRLSSTSSNIMLPRWHPAGTRVVFYEGDPSYNSQLYSVDITGARTLVNGGTGPRSRFFPTYSADGQQLFFTAYSSTSYVMEIWTSQADGSAPTKLVSSPDVSSNDPSPSPDGTKLVFSRGAMISTFELGSKALKSLGANGRFPRYSPDGTQIVFLTPSASYDFNLAVMNADGSNVRVLTTRTYDVYGAPSWSPDGTWVLLRGYGNLDLVRASNFEVLPVPKLNFSQASFKP